MEGDGGEGIEGERDGDWAMFGFRRNTLDEEVARIKWEAWRIDEWHVMVCTIYQPNLQVILIKFVESRTRRDKEGKTYQVPFLHPLLARHAQ